MSRSERAAASALVVVALLVGCSDANDDRGAVAARLSP